MELRKILFCIQTYMVEYMWPVCAVAGVTIEILSSSRSLKHFDKVGLASMIETGLILHTYCMRYPLANPFLNCFWYFLTPKTLRYCLGGVHLWLTLNLLKYGLFCSYPMHAQAFLEYALRDQKHYPISLSGFFLTNIIGNYLFSVLNYLRILFYW